MNFERMAKVEFPRFSEKDVKGWIYRCQQFFKIDDVPDYQKGFPLQSFQKIP